MIELLNDPESTAQIEWLDNQTVVINGYTLEIPNGKYDWRQPIIGEIKRSNIALVAFFMIRF